jgi:hypothetical protein
MGCACEDGSRDSFHGTILRVDDLESLTQAIKQMKISSETFREELLKAIHAAPPDSFAVLIKVQDGSEMSVNCEVFPQTKGWARERIGKPLHFTITQLPNRRGGGISMDVHEMAKR